MKKTILALILCLSALVVTSQNASVEKSIYGIQTGLLGIWVHNEAKLTDKITLRSEIGFDTGLFIGSYVDGIDFLLTPVITLEPRWYYNLNKRVSKTKNISGNSGNFISIKTSYNPDWFVISKQNYFITENQISIIPTWGIKRSIGNHFTYETGIGIGYRYFFERQNRIIQNKGEAALNLHVRIGYNFK